MMSHFTQLCKKHICSFLDMSVFEYHTFFSYICELSHLQYLASHCSGLSDADTL